MVRPSLVVQWLILFTPNTGDLCSIYGQGTKILHQCSQKKYTHIYTHLVILGSFFWLFILNAFLKFHVPLFSDLYLTVPQSEILGDLGLLLKFLLILTHDDSFPYVLGNCIMSLYLLKLSLSNTEGKVGEAFLQGGVTWGASNHSGKAVNDT